MLNIFTVSFFGHRSIERVSEIENRLDKLLHDIITQKEYVEFLIGREGNLTFLLLLPLRELSVNMDTVTRILLWFCHT